MWYTFCVRRIVDGKDLFVVVHIYADNAEQAKEELGESNGEILYFFEGHHDPLSFK
jgi:hypothetical protein